MTHAIYNSRRIPPYDPAECQPCISQLSRELRILEYGVERPAIRVWVESPIPRCLSITVASYHIAGPSNAIRVPQFPAKELPTWAVDDSSPWKSALSPALQVLRLVRAHPTLLSTGV